MLRSKPSPFGHLKSAFILATLGTGVTISGHAQVLVPSGTVPVSIRHGDNNTISRKGSPYFLPMLVTLAKQWQPLNVTLTMSPGFILATPITHDLLSWIARNANFSIAEAGF
jgi:hypothetical protein